MKKALIMTYHVLNSIKRGGFHSFIEFLLEDGYNVDVYTGQMNISWLYHKDDRANVKNFFRLWWGRKTLVGEKKVREFSIPMLIPRRVAKLLGLKTSKEYWPKWKRIAKRLENNYDLILVESVACQYASDIKTRYPNTKIVYRPSDVLTSYSEISNAKELEIEMIRSASVSICVDPMQIEYYKTIVGSSIELSILPNPIVSNDDCFFASRFVPCFHERKTIVYMGVSFFDNEMIEYAAKKLPDMLFYIIGPLGFSSHDNIVYTGRITKQEYELFFESADVAINPIISNSFITTNNYKYGYTGKILGYMKYLLPIVATHSDNYFHVDGFFPVASKDSFVEKIVECVSMTPSERMRLRTQYLKVMHYFLRDDVKNKFDRIIGFS